MILLASLLVILGVLLILHLYTITSRIRWVLRSMTGPPTWPILGNLLIFNVPVEKQWSVIRRLTKEYYPIAKILFGPFHVYVSLRHPDDLEVLLTSQKHITKGDSYSYLHPWLKSGLLTSTGEKWRQRRKILTPAFHFNILKKYMDITNENGIKFIEALKLEGKESVQNLVTLCSKYTLSIILESAMGINLEKLDKKTSEKYVQALHQNGSIVVYRIARPYITDWMMNTFMKLGSVQKRALQILLDFTQKVVRERREYHERTDYKYINGVESDEKESDSNDVYLSRGRRKRLAMLDLLLSAEQEGVIDNDGIMEEVDTFTFEGHDTTAAAMTFTIMLLAENEEAQDKARAEVTQIFDRCDGKIEMQDIQDMTYLEWCVKEALRLYPPVSTMTRTITEDLQLKDFLVPAGTEVIFHLYDTHRDPNFWEDPDKFDPERFSPERSHGRHPFSYLPFSAGPRNCIGQKFALMELKSLMARILYDFKLEPVIRLADIGILLDIIIRPSKPVFTKFIRIDKSANM
ncbi:hypothetical protein TKK_0013539 [Trichogramma kaykai]|uniref:Cytochrome P450 n=1 Tax=Trichogramma kaykai TaxID=54128 RepID=A0ABD2WI50_9HYME